MPWRFFVFVSSSSPVSGSPVRSPGVFGRPDVLVVRSIRETHLDEGLSRAHFVVDDAKWIAAEWAGMSSPQDLSDDEAADILLRGLGV